MKKFSARLLCVLLLCAGSILRAADEPLTLVVEPQGEGEFDYNTRTGVAAAENGVIVRYGTAGYLSAQKVSVNQETGEVLAEGNVHVEHDGRVWSGSSIVYNFKTRELSTGPFRTGQLPYFVEGPGLELSLTNRLFMTTNSVLTTDDYAEPGYTVRAKRITIVPGRYIEAKGATLWVGKMPVFYMPMLRRSLETHPNFWVLTPGYRSLWGPYLLSSYHRVWSKEFETALELDYRQKRGVGIGPEVTWSSPTAGEGVMRYYYIHDEDAGHTPMTGLPIEPDRQRFWFSYNITLRSNLTAKATVAYQSDPYLIRDFFESEYRENQQPNTFVELNQDWSNWNLNLEVQPRVNDFQESVERLPDVRFTGLRQQLGESPFFYDSVSSVGYYEHLWPESYVPPLLNYPLPYSAMRADTYHQILIPLTFFGWLNVSPRAGERFSYYGKADGPGDVTDEEGRAVFNTGVEFSFKASRVWRNTRSSLLDVNGLRHIVQPSLNYAYIPNPSPPPGQIPQFDSLYPSYWLLPLDFPDYNDIDWINAQNAMRIGLINRLQTKRQDGMDFLLNWNMFTDWRLQQNPGQTTLSPFFSVLDFKPQSWLTFSSLTRYDLNNARLLEVFPSTVIHPGSDWSVVFGYRNRRTEEFGPTDTGCNLILTSVGYRLNENWAARAAFQFDVLSGIMEQQQYTLYRDLRSWTTALSFRYRQNVSGPADYTVAFTFSLKAFPRYSLGKDTDRPSALLGG